MRSFSSFILVVIVCYLSGSKLLFVAGKWGTCCVKKSILHEPIYVTAKIKTGTLTVDLSDENIYIEGDVLLAIEHIKNFGKGTALSFSMNNSNSKSKTRNYLRLYNQTDWRNYSENNAIGFWATVLYEK